MDARNNFSGLRSLKHFNKHAILDLIRFSPGGISRAELARQLGLSRAAVTAIIDSLLVSGWVKETQVVMTSTGRRPILLEINPARGYVLGIDMGASHLSVALADLSGRVVNEEETAFDISTGPQACLKQVDHLARELVQQAGLHWSDILAAGVGVPGPISSLEGTVIAPPIMPGWDRYPIRAKLQQWWNMPVSLNNDAELGAVGEWAFGAGRAEDHLVYIKVGSGIGAGLLLDRQIYRGATGSAGEIGHMIMVDQGPLCTCGKSGCLEALAGGRAIAHQARQAALSGLRTQLEDISPADQITVQDVISAAGRGDLVSQQIISQAGAYLGAALAGLINLLNPGIVVIGGVVATAGDLLIEPIRQAAKDRSLIAAVQTVRITSAVLGRQSSSYGAVLQALSLVLHGLPNEQPASVAQVQP